MKIKLIVFCLSLFVLCFNLTSQTIRYVKPVSSGTGDGSSWANASSDLQSMINSSLAYDEIWVAAGTYKPTLDPFGNASPTDLRNRTFLLKDSVLVFGGFNGTETNFSQRDFTTNISILNGDFNSDDVISGTGATLNITGNIENAYHVVLSVNDSSITKLDGFTVSGGYAYNSTNTNITVETRTVISNEGGGLNLTYSRATITNCILKENHGSFGSGLNCNNSPSQLSYLKFYKNKSISTGGGARAINASTSFTSCYFEGNNTGTRGGGLSIAQANALVLNCSFYNNYSGSEGGGIHINSGIITPKIYNCLFDSNQSVSYGSGICVTSGAGTNLQPQIYNCTLVNNLAGANGGAIAANGTAGVCSPKIRNCIVWGNLGTGTQGVAKYNTAVPAVNNCIVQGGFGGACVTCPGVNGDIDPQYKNTLDVNGIDNIFGTSDDGVFLKSTSPAINVGDATILSPLTDITNFTRTGIFDLGAYEYRCLETSSTTNLTICSSELPYTWNGFIYIAGGTHIDTITNDEGCDSILTLNLTVNNVTSSTTYTTICSTQLPYTWNNLTFNSSGIQTATLVNSNGCDSLATLNLIVNNASASNNYQTICSSELPYTWNGLTFNTAGIQTATLTNSVNCDSLATLNLIVNNSSVSTTNLTICSYDLPYTWNNIVFPGPGSQSASLTNSVGCDSIATLNLSVIDPTYLSVSAADETLTADETNATYQWISCDSTTNASIPGETNQSFTATVNGNYAVIVTTPTCSDTSGCFNIATIGIKKQERAVNKITISPNPNNGSFTIDLKEESNIIISDALGRKVFEKTLHLGQQKIDLQNENPGVYLIHVINNNYSQTNKFILNK